MQKLEFEQQKSLVHEYVGTCANLCLHMHTHGELQKHKGALFYVFVGFIGCQELWFLCWQVGLF